MQRHIAAACGAVALVGATLSAQSTTPAQQSPAPSLSGANAITVQGCLKPAGGSTMGSTGTAGATAGANATQYTLTNAEMKPGTMGSAATGTTPATPDPAAPARTTGMGGKEYWLKAEGTAVNLAQHVNHQVEVVGRLTAPSMTSTTGTTGTTPGTPGTPSTPATGTTGTATGTAGLNRAAGEQPMLTVTSLTMISATCK